MRGPLWLLLLLQVVVSISAQSQKPLDADLRKDAGERLNGDVATPQGGGSPIREPGTDDSLGRGGASSRCRANRYAGQDMFDAAVLELRKIHDLLRHRKFRKRGAVNMMWNLVLTALPTLRINTPPPFEPSQHSMSGPLIQAVKLLQESSSRNNSDALYVLAAMNFFGNYSHPRNFGTAFDYYKKLALLNGNSSAMYMLGLMYSTGIGGAVQPDQARALLYYTVAANAGHLRAEITVANRHLAGIGTPAICESAAKYYKRAADKTLAWFHSGPPGGLYMLPEAYRIADENGGAYGQGASAVSAGPLAIKAHPNSDVWASIQDIVEYLDLMSQKGDFKASFNLGRIYHDGQRGLERDLTVARKYFHKVTSKFWTKRGIAENHKPGLDKIASKSAGFIGRMFLRGDGVEQNFAKAEFWFNRGIAHGDAQAHWGMGVMLLDGLGRKKNGNLATEHFRKAADQDFGPAQTQLALLFLDQGKADDVTIASHYFEQAARHGNLEAFYYLGEINHYGIGREKSCSTAVNFYKGVVERAEMFVSPWSEANMAYENGDYELALLDYLVAAEEGYEKAQNNVAYILDPDNSRLPVPDWLIGRNPKSSLLQNSFLALVEWTRSWKQNSIDSLVKMGDYYLYGIGTDPDVDKAIQCYQGASEYHQSAQALYNLGWMHEYGVGLTQDYHLAKRYYDLALVTNKEAKWPVTISLCRLQLKSWWNTITHGRINSIRDEPAPQRDWSVSDWISNFLQDDVYYDEQFDDSYQDTELGGEPALSGFDESVKDSLLIFGLATALVVLVLYRNNRQARAQQQNEERERQQRQRARGDIPAVPAAGALAANGIVDEGWPAQPGQPGAEAGPLPGVP